jgi:hypothetical protein
MIEAALLALRLGSLRERAMSETNNPPKPGGDDKRDVEEDDSFPASDPPSTTPVRGPGGEETE